MIHVILNVYIMFYNLYILLTNINNIYVYYDHIYIVLIFMFIGHVFILIILLSLGVDSKLYKILIREFMAFIWFMGLVIKYLKILM